MLPELLFSVGSSMQDISREEFSLLNGGCDKESTIITGTDCTLERIKLGRTPDIEPVSIKLEEPDIFPWHTTTDIGSNLLRHSDDPLISGAIDDNQNEFNPIKCSKLSIPTTGGATTTTTPASTVIVNRKKVSRTRRKGQFKLRFHHQALPQEYLDHYEATQNILQKKEAEQNKAAAIQKGHDNNHHNTSPMEVNDQLQAARTHDSVRNWLQKISEFQQDNCISTASPSVSVVNRGTASSATPGIKYEPTNTHHGHESNNTPPSTKRSSRVVSYNDLPYMGEMTLDNSKPRRGRKPKKADICHLIYKNYGTILPGTPKDMVEMNEKTTIDVEPTRKTDIQAKIIGSLLEKRLTNEGKTAENVVPKSKVIGGSNLKMIDGKLQAEPLNLCVRDRSDTLTVSSDDDTDSCYVESTRASPLIAPSEIDTLLAANLKMSLPNFQTAMLEKTSEQTPTTGDIAPPGYVYWPNAGVFIHPMALYYQKIVDSGNPSSTIVPPPLPSTTTSSTPSNGGTSTPAVSPMPMPSPSPPSRKEQATTAKILIPKKISQLLKQEKLPPVTGGTMSEASSGGSSSKSTTPAPQKRKRSAIFIPPMPVESSSNHATEVSICKFKFTGGAKPSLQEKKMLSVDSGGNFRYYSGTGDKSMRGYEFFPRESLQQSSLLAGSSAGAFLNTPGEKISIDLPPPSLGLSNELLQIPELPSSGPGVISGTTLLSHHVPISSIPIVPSPPSTAESATSQSNQRPHRHHHHRTGYSNERRKRKSRRSLQREKLEKTFKEKGFLIQTQQLESAEGATYCKFRQLRKFTRYLFRSWKDYLPGDIQHQATQQNMVGNVDGSGTAPILLSSSTPNSPLESTSTRQTVVPVGATNTNLSTMESSPSM